MSPTSKPVTASEKVAVTVKRPEKTEAVDVKVTVGATVSATAAKLSVVLSVIPAKALDDRSSIAVASTWI